MSRARRDPRRERLEATVSAAPRPRIDRHRPGAPAARPLPAAAVSASARKADVRIVDDPAFWVAVLADPAAGGLSAHDGQVLGAARRLAGEEGGVLLVADRPIDEAGAAGADRIVLAVMPDHPAARARVAAQMLKPFAPRHVLAPETPDGGDIVRRLAASAGQGCFAGANLLSGGRMLRTVHARGIDQLGEAPAFITIAPDSFAPYGGAPCEARPATMETVPRPDVAEVERLRPVAGKLPLAEADLVLSAGNGVNDFDAFRQLAEALGATPGASRVVCDAGLMPREAQVGASGTVLAATCYVALGIAGAPQHLLGIAGCRHVVAVNTDLHAAMVERAGLAVVADAQAVMGALLALLASEQRR